MFYTRPQNLNFASMYTEPVENPTTGFMDVFRASQASDDAGREVLSSYWNLSSVYDDHNAKVKALTGKELSNPRKRYPGSFADADEMQRYNSAVRQYRDDGGTASSAAFYERWAEDEYRRKLDEITAQHPDKRGELLPETTFAQQAMARVGRAETTLQKAKEGYGSNAWIPEIIGSIWGGHDDPVFWLTAPIGFGGAGAGIKGLALAALKNGTANAAVEASLQPWVQSYRSQAGVSSGIEDAAYSVGGAFAFGAGIDAGVRGIARTLRAGLGYQPVVKDGVVVSYRKADDQGAVVSEIPAETVSKAEIDEDPAAIRQIAEATGLADREPVVRATLDDMDANEVMLRKPVETVPDVSHQGAVTQSLRHVADPVTEPLPVVRDGAGVPELRNAEWEISEARSDLQAVAQAAQQLAAQEARYINRMKAGGSEKTPEELSQEIRSKQVEQRAQLEAATATINAKIADLTAKYEDMSRVLMSEDLIEAVASGTVRREVADLVAEYVPDHDMHLRMAKDLTERKPQSPDEARRMVHELMNSPDYRPRREPDAPAPGMKTRALDDPYGPDAKAQVDQLERQMAEELGVAAPEKGKGGQTPERGGVGARTEAAPREAFRDPETGDALEASDVESIVDMWRYVRETRKKKPETLTAYLIRMGRIKDESGELTNILGGKSRHLISGKGMTLDDAALVAHQDGFFTNRPDVATLLDAIDNDVRGNHLFRDADFNAAEDWRVAQDMEADLGRLGVDTARTEDEVRAYFRNEDAGAEGAGRGQENSGGTGPEAAVRTYADAKAELIRRVESGDYNEDEFYRLKALVESEIADVVARLPERTNVRVTMLPEGAEGVFDNRGIMISMLALDPAAIIRHEEIHALKASGLFSDAEWGLLVKKAKESGISDEKFLEGRKSIREAYPEIYGERFANDAQGLENKIIEESVAYMVQRRAEGSDFGPEANGLIDRIAQFFERLRNALSGYGFRTVDDVLKAIEAGDVARRGSADVMGGEAMFALRTVRDDEPSDAVQYRTNKDGFEMRLPFKQKWGDPRFDDGDQARAIARLDEIASMNVKDSTWDDIVQAYRDINEINSQLMYYAPDLDAKIYGPDVFLYLSERSGNRDGASSIYTRPDIPADIAGIVKASRDAVDHLVASKRRGVEDLLRFDDLEEPEARKRSGPQPDRVSEKMASGFYFDVGRKLEQVPDALFQQGGWAVINALRQAGVKRAEIEHFRLGEQLGGTDPTTREQFKQAIAERTFDIRRKTSWLNPERSKTDYEMGGTRAFRGPRIPGRGIYFERLMAFPKRLKGGEEFAPGMFESPHWDGVHKGTWASWRGSVRDIDGLGKVLIGEEGQSDFMQGVTSGRRPRVSDKEFLKIKADSAKYNKVHENARKLLHEAVGSRWGGSEEVKLAYDKLLPRESAVALGLPEWLAALNEVRALVKIKPDTIAPRFDEELVRLRALDALEAIRRENEAFFSPEARGLYTNTSGTITPSTPIDETYTRTMVRDLLLLAAKEDADTIAIATTDTTNRIQSNTYESAGHFYDTQLKTALERELRTITGNGTLKLEKVALPKAMGAPRNEKAYTVWASPLSTEAKAAVKAEGLPMFALRNAKGQKKLGADERAANLKADLDDIEARFQAAGGDERAKLQAKRAAFLNAKAEEIALDDVAGFRDLKGQSDPAKAFLFLHESFGDIGAKDLKHARDVIQNAALEKFSDVVWGMRKGAITGDLRRVLNPQVKTSMTNMIKELAGENTGDATAKVYANAWKTTAEYLRQRFNAAGGDIALLKNWIMPQYHDPDALMKMGKRKWIDYLIKNDMLDRDAMINPLTGRAYTTAQLRETLDYIWRNITSNGALSREVTGFSGSGAMYKRHADHRVLMFKSADSWIAYQRDVGGGDFYATMIGHISMMARDIAAMERFGANPELVRTRLKQHIVNEAAQARSSKSMLDELNELIGDLRTQFKAIPTRYDELVSKMAELHGKLDAARSKSSPQVKGRTKRTKSKIDDLQAQLFAVHEEMKQEIQSASPLTPEQAELQKRIGDALDEIGRIDAYPVTSRDPQQRAQRLLQRADEMWAAYSGSSNVPADGILAGFFQGTRNVLSSSMLVFAPMSAVTDQSTQLAARLMVGIPATRQLWSFIKAFTPADRKKALAVGLGLDQAQAAFEVQARYLGSLNAHGITGYLTDRTHAFSFLSPMTQASKTGFGLDAINAFTGMMETAWNDLSSNTRDWLSRNGITPDDWAVLQSVPLQDIGGAGVLTRRAIEAVDPDLAEKYQIMVLRSRGKAVLEGTMRGRTLIVSDTQKGSAVGEVARSFAMLKSFPISYTMLVLGEIYGQIMRGRYESAMAYGTAIFVVGTLLGATAIQMKNIAQGRDPEDMTDPKFWGRAFAQSGGSGIYGDFISSSVGRNGQGFTDTLAGPVWDQFGSAIDLTAGSVMQYAKDEPVPVGRKLTNFMRRNTPGALAPWYVRTAYERMIIDELQKQVDPDAHKSFRSKVSNRKRVFGNDYFWSPGQSSASRGPDMSAAFGGQ